MTVVHATWGCDRCFCTFTVPLPLCDGCFKFHPLEVDIELLRRWYADHTGNLVVVRYTIFQQPK